MGPSDEPKGFIEEAFEHWQKNAESAEPPAATESAEPPAATESAEPPAATESADPPAVTESADVEESVEPVPDEGRTATEEPTEVATPPEPEPLPEPMPLGELALVEEAAKKSGLIWVRTSQNPAGRSCWHVWFEGGFCLLTGG